MEAWYFILCNATLHATFSIDVSLSSALLVDIFIQDWGTLQAQLRAHAEMRNSLMRLIASAASALILHFRTRVPQLQETTIMMHFKLTRRALFGRGTNVSCRATRRNFRLFYKLFLDYARR